MVSGDTIYIYIHIYAVNFEINNEDSADVNYAKILRFFKFVLGSSISVLSFRMGPYVAAHSPGPPVVRLLSVLQAEGHELCVSRVALFQKPVPSLVTLSISKLYIQNPLARHTPSSGPRLEDTPNSCMRFR